MKDETNLLINLINQNKSLQEITNIMNISKKQLFAKMAMLRQCGYLIDKKYYDNGKITYYLKNPFEVKAHNILKIEPTTKTSTIRLVATADSHYGNIKESLKCTDKTFDYCTKNGINLILHLGDFFEGVCPNFINHQKYNSVTEQIQKTLSNYPLVDDILTITLLGNHDASFWLDAGIDIKTILENRRHDIIPIGYEQGELHINNYSLLLNHPINRVEDVDFDKSPYSRISFIGHSHRFKIVNKQRKIDIYVPSSSNITSKSDMFLGNGIPSILDAELIVTGNVINKVIINQYILYNNTLIKVGELEENVTIPRMTEEDYLSHSEIKPKLKTCFDESEEEFDKSEEEIIDKHKILAKKQNAYTGMSQIEKFNSKYGFE